MMPEITVAVEAIHSEVRIARMNTSLWRNTTYQRSDRPCGGKVRKLPAFSEASDDHDDRRQQEDVDEEAEDW